MPLYASGAQPAALPDADQASDQRTPWWTTPFGRWRLSVEAEAMKRFPGFESRELYGHLVWIGSLLSSVTPGSEYLVALTYPHEFPDEAPWVSIVEPELAQGAPHLLQGNRPCLYMRQGPRHGYDPARTTAATLIAWTALWIHAYETWRATDEWPGAAD